VVDHQQVGAVGQLGHDALLGHAHGGERLFDLGAHRLQALVHVAGVDEVGGEQSHDRLVLDPRQRRRRPDPLGESVAPLFRQRVVGPLVRAPGRLVRLQVAVLGKPLRLRVPLARRGVQ
jgi:hypothetical protein